MNKNTPPNIITLVGMIAIVWITYIIIFLWITKKEKK